eukprot:7038392-Lingulodinium_polyedra.AAC.1
MVRVGAGHMVDLLCGGGIERLVVYVEVAVELGLEDPLAKGARQTIDHGRGVAAGPIEGHRL